MSRLRALAAVASLAVLAACTADSSPAPEPGPARPDVDLSFTQLLPEEGTRHALLRVINPGTRSVDVTAVGIAWEGYGNVLQPTDGHKEIRPGAQLMLRFELPPPRCGPSGGRAGSPVRGRVTVDGVDLEQQLTAPAQVYVRRLWRRQCDRLLLDRATDLEWRLVEGPSEEGRVATELRLSRGSGKEAIEVIGLGGTVLYRLHGPRRAVLTPAEDAEAVPLAILPGNRCDEHAIGQATAPYDFSVTLQVGTRRMVQALHPPLAMQNAASRMLLRHCGSKEASG
jgi:hypothetical protein